MEVWARAGLEDHNAAETTRSQRKMDFTVFGGLIVICDCACTAVPHQLHNLGGNAAADIGVGLSQCDETATSTTPCDATVAVYCVSKSPKSF